MHKLVESLLEKHLTNFNHGDESHLYHFLKKIAVNYRALSQIFQEQSISYYKLPKFWCAIPYTYWHTSHLKNYLLLYKYLFNFYIY
jgi:hypothetical protein